VLWFAFDKVHDWIFVVDELYERGLTPEELAFRVLATDEKYDREVHRNAAKGWVRFRAL
jgi:hypothetical protein